MPASRRLRIWLATCAGLVFAMIVVGGLTRVTRSGLSITTWNPVTGVLPPLGDDAWRAEFARYQASPEGMRVNVGMSLEQFRGIFWVEYVHRLLGRLVGVVLLVPLVIFLARRELSLRRAGPLFGVLLAGAAQGALGWYMVKSGLASEPHVSPYRLASHLLVGMALLAWLTWSACSELARPVAAPNAGRVIVAALVGLFAAIGYGGLMAGHHAGLLCPTFPTMNGAWVPSQLRLSSARAWFADAWTVHWLHRALALVVSALVLAVVAYTWPRGSRRVRALSIATLACVANQIVLGALLVLQHVPPTLAVLHQANAALALVLLVVMLREFIPHVSRDISHLRSGGSRQQSSSVWPLPPSQAQSCVVRPTTRSPRPSKALHATPPHC